MRDIIRSLLLLLTILNPAAHAAIMGDKDSRIEMYQLPEDWKALAGATVAFSTSSHIVKVYNDWKTFSGGRSLKDSPMVIPNVTPKHRFADQPNIVDCTGVMVTQDIMITAAHCLPENGDINQLSHTQVVAGLGYASEDQLKTDPLMIPLNAINITEIAQLLYVGTPTQTNAVSDSDFAVVQLKKPLLAVKPVTLQRGFKGDYQTPVAILGHQLSLPLKADLEGKVAVATDASQKIALMFMDTGGGNSGGPIFDPKTKSLIGLLIASGGRDWLDCDAPGDDGVSHSQYSCESHRPETVEQLENAPQAKRKLIKQFWARYPSGIITAWASRVIRVDQIMDKLTELGIKYDELK
ncbi:MAG: trypsin-like peptidase domain-containing protein [Bdellovibrionales bacterium]|nr:trypsin-like peptidase domain-containing protein [Bdellovibrionales bacterium]